MILSTTEPVCLLKILQFHYTGEKMPEKIYTNGNVMTLPKMIFSCHFNNMPVVHSLMNRIYTELS